MTARYWDRSRRRLDCLIHGHRDVASAAAYGELPPGHAAKELHYCGSCGGPVWVEASGTRAPRDWATTGLPMK